MGKEREILRRGRIFNLGYEEAEGGVRRGEGPDFEWADFDVGGRQAAGRPGGTVEDCVETAEDVEGGMGVTEGVEEAVAEVQGLLVAFLLRM